MASALVLGVNGQDGSYIAEALLDRGCAVTGIGRQAVSRWVDPARFNYVQLDVANADPLSDLLARAMPDQIYHMAAVHGSAGHVYEDVWRQALAVNVGSVHTCLEHMRLRSPATRLFYPSSLKVFGNPPPTEIDETTPRVSSCLYSITKNAATELIHYYRAQHGSWAAVSYYFNHDSPRRPDSYFLPRLAAQIAASMRHTVPAPGVATLDFWCDWGSSREFMEMTVDLLGKGRAAGCSDGDRAAGVRRGSGPRPGRTRGSGPASRAFAHPRRAARTRPLGGATECHWPPAPRRRARRGELDPGRSPGARAAPVGEDDGTTVTRILLGMLASNGDCLYATAIARQIKVDFPGCHLTWAIGSLSRQVLANNPDIDQVWELPQNSWSEMERDWTLFEIEAHQLADARPVRSRVPYPDLAGAICQL